MSIPSNTGPHNQGRAIDATREAFEQSKCFFTLDPADFSVGSIFFRAQASKQRAVGLVIQLPAADHVKPQAEGSSMPRCIAHEAGIASVAVRTRPSMTASCRPAIIASTTSGARNASRVTRDT